MAFFTAKVFSLSISVFPYRTVRDTHSSQKVVAPHTGQAIPYPLSVTFVTRWVAPLTGLRLLVCVVVLWAGAVTLSLGAQEKEICITSLAVCGPRAPACLAALVAFLTPTTRAFSIISVPTLQQALFAQLEPARSAGVALHAVGSFTGPAGVMAGHTPVAVLVSVVAFWAAFNTGRVEKKSLSRAGIALVLGRPRAVGALPVTWLAPVSALIPVLNSCTLLGRCADLIHDRQAFLTSQAGPF